MLIQKLMSQTGLTFLLIVLVLSACTKEKVLEISYEKIPITTSSPEAAAYFQSGLNASDKLQTYRANSFYGAALEQDPQFARCWMNLAFVGTGTDLFLAYMDSAKFYAEKASKGEQLLISAAIYGAENKKLKQKQTLIELTELYPGDERAHLALGNYYFELQQYRQAVEVYTRATSINSELAILHNQLGYSQRALGNYGEAEKAFKFYIRLNPENANAFDSYAELLMEMGRFKESIEYYEQALAKDSTFMASYIGIACCHGFLGEPEKAREQINLMRAASLSYMDLRKANYTEAVSYVYEGNLSQAVVVIQENLRIAEENRDVVNMGNDLANMGNLYLEIGSIEAAKAKFEKSIQVMRELEMPASIKSMAEASHHFNTARIYVAEGSFKAARDEAEKYASWSQEQNNPLRLQRSFQLNGIIALHEKEFQRAIDQFEQANQMNPYNLYRMGLAYEGLGMRDEAATMIQRAEELNVLNSMNQALVLSKTKFRKKELS